jgi:hypothetical protein
MAGSNARSIPNYGERYRAGETISSSLAESAVNQVVSKRMVKKQQMRWTPRASAPPAPDPYPGAQRRARRRLPSVVPRLHSHARSAGPVRVASPGFSHSRGLPNLLIDGAGGATWAGHGIPSRSRQAAGYSYQPNVPLWRLSPRTRQSHRASYAGRAVLSSARATQTPSRDHSRHDVI